MKLDYELAEQDYINFNLYHIEHSDTMRKSLFIQAYVIPLLFFLIPFALGKSTRIPLWYWFAAFTITYVLWALFYKKYFRWSISKRITKLVREGQNSSLLGKRSISFTDSGIVETGGATEAKTGWEAIESIVETKDYIFLYNSTVSAYIIPVSAFAEPNQKAELINQLNTFVPRHKVKSK